jgi:hypothetical protein
MRRFLPDRGLVYTRGVGRVAAWAPAVASLVICGCAFLPVPSPAPRAGRLTAPDGTSVADATVTVESWRLDGERHVDRVNVVTTRTDRDGRWQIHGRTRLLFGAPRLIPPLRRADEYTFSAAGYPDLRASFGPPLSPVPAPAPDAQAMRVDWTGVPPASVLLLPVLGVAGGEGQHVAGHLGGMFLAGRRYVAGGLRLAGTVGDRGYGGGAGPVFIACCAAAPILGVEVNARYLRPWTITDDRAPIYGLELALDLAVFRFTFASYGHEVATPVGHRTFTIGLGVGYF